MASTRKNAPVGPVGLKAAEREAPAKTQAKSRRAPLPPALAEPAKEEDKHPLLVSLGERVRLLRARSGMTRRALAAAADVSERHLANLELGQGNASVLILSQVAAALQCPLAALVGDVTTSSPEWLMIRQQLESLDEAALHRVRLALPRLLGAATACAGSDASGLVGAARGEACGRIALIGLRGAGKSTLGRLLAEALDVPFIELSAEVEKMAGCSVAEIQALYGQNAYRRHERRALDEVINTYPAAVVATPGGIVSDAATFNTLLSNFRTVWLKATPEAHMSRVVEQGDTRPMGRDPRAMAEAMDDLRSILAGREAFYAKADHTLDTCAADLPATFEQLRLLVTP